MRSLLVLVDGLGDDPIPAWDGETPFTRSRHPHMDALVETGTLAHVSISGKDVVPGSLTCILRLLGVAKEQFPSNRAYLELLAQGRDISEFEMVLRCNIVSEDEGGRMVSFNGMGLTPRDIEEITAKLGSFSHDIEFLHLSDYRNLLVMTRSDGVLATETAPPHESMGLPLEELLGPLREASLSMRVFMDQADRILEDYSRNGLRYRIPPWGPSCRTALPSSRSLNGRDGALVCQTEIVRGIGHALDMEVPPLEGCTADIDTDIRAKLEATRDMLKKYPFVLAHFNGADEAAHRHDYEGKAAFVARIDREFLGPLLESADEPMRILICGDHVTSSVTGKHTRGGGPVIAAVVPPAAEGSQIPPLRTYRDIIQFITKESEENG